MMEIPPFASYSHSLPLNPDQKRFYGFWRERWDAGEAVPVNGNTGYLYEYLFRSIQSLQDVYPRLAKILLAYGQESEPFDWQCRRWLSDHYLWTREYEAAIENFPPFTLGRLYTHAANELLNMKRLVMANVKVSELLALVGPDLTLWSREFLPHVCREFESALIQMQLESGVSLIVEWTRGEKRYTWHLFNGLPSRAASRLRGR